MREIRGTEKLTTQEIRAKVLERKVEAQRLGAPSRKTRPMHHLLIAIPLIAALTVMTGAHSIATDTLAQIRAATTIAR